jgi:DNA polymerase III subunit delta
MQIAPAQLSAHLNKGLRTLYTVWGDEALLVQEACDSIRAAARAAGHSERHVHTAQGARFDWSGVLASGASGSLFADKQVLEVRVPTGKPGKDGGSALQTLAERSATDDSTLTLIVLPRLDAATQKTAWFAALGEYGATLKVDSVDRQALPQWIAQRLAAQGQHVAEGVEGQNSLQFFADRVEGNLLAAHQEIQKLALLHPPGELRLHDIESAVLNVARYDPFALAQAVLAGRLERVPRMLDGLQAEGTAAVLVHYALAEDIRTLARVRADLDDGLPVPVALRNHRVWGPREKLIERAVQRLNSATLAQWLRHAHTVDGIAKGLKPEGWPHDPWQALLRLAIMVARACAPQQRT